MEIKRWTALLLFEFMYITAYGQELKIVEALHLAPFEIISSKNIIKDGNGEPCALVKVLLPVEGVQFEGNIVNTLFNINEYLCYMTSGTKRFRIRHTGCQPLDITVSKDVEPAGLQPKKCYVIKLELPQQLKSEMPEKSQNSNYSKYILNKLEEGKRFDKEKDYKNAFKCFQIAAEAGNAEAQFHISLYYREGLGVKKNYIETEKWLLKSAENGYRTAQSLLGTSYRYGDEYWKINKDYQKAFIWNMKAAEQGDKSAQFTLGELYKNGYGVNRDYKEAVKWYKSAADQGYALAQICLGDCYAEGIGVDINIEEAIAWYQKAAEQGDATYQNHLAGYYFKLKRFEDAVAWYKKAAEQGNTDAQVELGKCYENGNGVFKDFNEAINWYTKAAEQKSYLKHYLTNLEKALKNKLILKVVGEKDVVIGAAIYHIRNGSEVVDTYVSDLDGKTTIKDFITGDTLKVDFIGYTTQEIKFTKIPTDRTYTIVMKAGDGDTKTEY